MSPEHVFTLSAEEMDQFLCAVNLSSHKEHVLRRLHDLLEEKPLPAPSYMKWEYVPRILEGAIPEASTDVKERKGTAEDDTHIVMLEEVFRLNFRNETEMEAVMRVGAVVLCAVKGLKVDVQLQPSVTYHPTFTDFLFLIKNPKQTIGLIKVKKSTDNTTFTLESDSHAQV